MIGLHVNTIARANADSTTAASSIEERCVLGRVWVAGWTMSLDRVLRCGACSAEHIDLVRNRLKVRRVHAGMIAAEMVEFEA